MSYSGEAEQVVRISLNGAEVAAKLTGAAAKNIAVMLYAVLKDQHRTKGKMRLSHKECLPINSYSTKPAANIPYVHHLG